MPNFGYHLARLKGNILRRGYLALLPLIVRFRLKAPRKIDIDVFAYSGEAMLPEQVASIRSFLRYVGRPRRFVVVSDGSHSARSRELLQQIDPVVSVSAPSEPPQQMPDKFREYLRTHPTGKQLSLVMSLPVSDCALYVDSDVRFFSGAADLANRISVHDAPAYYLEDCQFSGDERLVRMSAEKTAPVNTGFLLMFEKLDWALAIERFSQLNGQPTFFTNQTLTHLTMHANGARAFDSARYVLQLDDQFVFSDRYASADLVLRHYVNPVRHKFWTVLKY